MPIWNLENDGAGTSPAVARSSQAGGWPWSFTSRMRAGPRAITSLGVATSPASPRCCGSQKDSP